MLNRLVPQLRPFLRSRPSLPSSSSLLAPSSSRLYATPTKKPPQKSTQLKDDLIPYPIISLVDPSTSSLLPPAKLSDILLSLDLSRFSLILVDSTASPPICRILDKKEAYTKAQTKKVKEREKVEEAAKEGARVGGAAGGAAKEVHITWGVTRHDLGHKLNKARELLGKGHRVTVVINDKTGVAAVKPEQRKEVISGVEEQLKEVAVLKKLPKGKQGQVFMEFQARPPAA
ncbi:translation initiation factor IF-3, partial [Phenoliferia sp. Uapishka_3]